MTTAPFPDILRRIIAIDCETSNLDPATGGLLEIGAVLLDRDGPTSFHREVRLEHWKSWDPESAKVHGITREEAANHRRHTDSVAVEDLLNWIEDVACRGIEGRAILAGMNPRFDLDFLRTAAELADLDARFRGLVSHRTIDIHTAVVLSHWRHLEYEPQRFPRGLDSLNSDRIAELLGMAPEPKPHRALAGAQRSRELLLALLGVGHESPVTEGRAA